MENQTPITLAEADPAIITRVAELGLPADTEVRVWRGHVSGQEINEYWIPSLSEAGAVVCGRPETLKHEQTDWRTEFFGKYEFAYEAYIDQCMRGRCVAVWTPEGKTYEHELVRRAKLTEDGSVDHGDTCPDCGEGRLEAVTNAAMCGWATRDLRCDECGSIWPLPSIRLPRRRPI